mmetsp:Transcript_18526/g.54163  ORF Transcript_18526/g.54163 Transcript_18526/m.54163 type:complete len:222 (+) Transcript_18526:4018-4683(+)
MAPSCAVLVSKMLLYTSRREPPRTTMAAPRVVPADVADDEAPQSSSWSRRPRRSPRRRLWASTPSVPSISAPTLSWKSTPSMMRVEPPFTLTADPALVTTRLSRRVTVLPPDTERAEPTSVPFTKAPVSVRFSTARSASASALRSARAPPPSRVVAGPSPRMSTPRTPTSCSGEARRKEAPERMIVPPVGTMATSVSRSPMPVTLATLGGGLGGCGGLGGG